MEIKLENLSYIENKKKFLNNINIKIKEGSIVGFIGDNLFSLTNILTLNKRPSTGSIILDNIEIKRTNHIDDIKKYTNKIGFVPDLDEYSFTKNTVELELALKNKIDDNNKHIIDSLKIVGLDLNALNKSPKELSYTEQKKILLAKIMCYNPDIIILENFSYGFNYRENEYFRKLFNKLKIKYHKTIIVLSDSAEPLMNFVDNFYVINNGNIVFEGDKKSFYKDKLYKYIEMPKIIEFTKYLQEKGHKIKEYTEITELIKEIYRYIKY